MRPPLNTPSADGVLTDAAATEAFGARLAALARPGDLIALAGDLGAGKTVLARGFLQARFGPVEVTSPTFTLIQIHGEGEGEVWHVDLYRLESDDELQELGLEEALERAVCLVEWPERLSRLRHDDRLDVTLTFAPDGARRVAVRAFGGWRGRWPGPP